MKDRQAQSRLTTRFHWPVHLVGYLLVLVLALRRRYDLVAPFSMTWLLSLLGLFALLYATEGLISRKVKRYHTFYFALQMVIIQCLGLFQEYQDTWAVLYISLGFQVAVRCTRRVALTWYALFVASLLITLSFEFGLISGPGRALAYVVIGVLLISYDNQYAQHQDALAESQMLVSELQAAHLELEKYVDQAEEVAALEEHDRMVQELYDSVGQKIFAIQLAAETTRLMIEKEPQKAPGQVENLQAQTQSALGQMRALIDQWRPG